MASLFMDLEARSLHVEVCFRYVGWQHSIQADSSLFRDMDLFVPCPLLVEGEAASRFDLTSLSSECLNPRVHTARVSRMLLCLEQEYSKKH